MPRNPSLEEKEVPVWANVVSAISFLIFLIVFIFAIWLIAQKTPKAEPVVQNRYEAYYGTFTLIHIQSMETSIFSMM